MSGSDAQPRGGGSAAPAAGTPGEHGRRKVWHTIGNPKLLILACYEMRVVVEPRPPSSRLTISISYDLAPSWFWRIAGLLLAGSYSRWCLRRMCHDTKRALESPAIVPP